MMRAGFSTALEANGLDHSNFPIFTSVAPSLT